MWQVKDSLDSRTTGVYLTAITPSEQKEPRAYGIDCRGSGMQPKHCPDPTAAEGTLPRLHIKKAWGGAIGDIIPLGLNYHLVNRVTRSVCL